MRRIALLMAGTALGFVLGCGGTLIEGPPEWILGSEPNVEGKSLDWYVLEYADTARVGTAQPLFAIVWRGGRGATAEGDGGGRITTINGYEVSPSFVKRAIYALEPDYTLNEIMMPAEDRDRLLSLMGAAEGPLSDDPLWADAIEPALRYVPSPGEKAPAQ